MQVLSVNSNKLETPTALALGMFDGVHIGHREVIKTATQYAKLNKIKTAVITLRNHPRELTKGKAPKLITNLDTRLALFEELDIDYVLVLDFDQELMNTSAEDYLKKYLINILNAKFVSTGYDHHFGKGRSGNTVLLEAWAKSNQITIETIDACKQGPELISSSKIRDLISEGAIQKANEMLGYQFMIISTVIEGDKRGRSLGFPTANLQLPADMVIPAKGVYCGSAEYQGQNFQAIMNIGTRPSFDDSDKITIEAHLLDCNNDLYHQLLKLRLNKRIRAEKKFDSAANLIKQIKEDIKQCTN